MEAMQLLNTSFSFYVKFLSNTNKKCIHCHFQSQLDCYGLLCLTWSGATSGRIFEVMRYHIVVTKHQVLQPVGSL